MPGAAVWTSPGALLADLSHVGAGTSPDDTLDRICAVLTARGGFARAAAVRVLPTGPAFGSAGLADQERRRLRATLTRVGARERGRNRSWVLEHCRLAPDLDICFLPVEQRPAPDWEVLDSQTAPGRAGERWEAGDELLLLPHRSDGESLGCVDLVSPTSGLRPTAAQAPALAELLAFAQLALRALDNSARAEERGRESARRVISAMEGLTAAGDVETLLQHLTEACARLAGFRVGVLTAHLEDGPHLGTFNLDAEEIETFRQSMRGSTAEGTAAKRRRIRELAFPGTSIAYVPHTADLTRGNAFRPSGDVALHSWHPDDRLFILMSAGAGGDRGVLSLDEPLDGHAPHPQALGSLRLAERLLALGTTLIEARLLQSQVLRARRLEALGTLAAGVAHDFNNLIGVILGYASLLRMSAPDPATTARMAGQIEEACRRAAALTGRLRDFSRLRGTTSETLAPTTLLTLVAERARGRAQRGVVVHADIPADLPAIAGDGRELGNCLDQLCLNALEAAPDGGNIWVHARADEGRYMPGEPRRRYVRICVDDDGPGIPEELRERVFEPFFSTRSREQHEGLGLFMAFSIARAHGGSLELGARPEGGASVRLLLPVPLVEDGARPSTADEPAPTAIRRGDSAHILVVEDEPAIQDVLRQALAALGHSYKVVGDGEGALDALDQEAERFDALLLDLVLPRRSGIEVFRHARALRPDLPVVLSSGNVEEGLLHPDVASGVSVVLPKPWGVGDLERALDRVLRSRGRALGPSSSS